MATQTVETTSTVAKGLAGVVAGTTSLSLVEGDIGRLSYRGININDLAEQSTFEETAYLLWYGALPTRHELAELNEQLVAERPLAEQVLAILRQFPESATPMSVLRTAVSALGLYDSEADDMSREANLRKAIRLTAKMPTIVAAFHRLRRGQELVPPRHDLNLAGNFLYMLLGKMPDDTSAHVLDVALVLHADHGLNASTFTARVAASTLSDMYSAVTAAIGTLKGPLHGGANEQVMKMLLDIDEVDRAEAWVLDRLARKEKIMGFGHRVYHANDPRALQLQRIAHELGECCGNPKWAQISERIREVMWCEKQLYMNVDFYSASVYYTLGIPTDLFPTVFALSRITGWTAHVLEQYADNKLIRPNVEYIGPREQPYVPLNQR
jgi:citrate synthase